MIHIIILEFLNSDISRFGESLRNNLFPNIPTFFGNLLASIILIFIIIRYAYAPFRESQHSKHDYIKNQIASANQKYAESHRNNNESKLLLDNANKQAKEILENGKHEANMFKEKKVAEINAYQKKVYLDTEREIEIKREGIQNEIKKQSVDLAIEIASKIIDKKINEKSMDKVIDDFLKSLNNDSK